ncbi:MAG: hypothetical protein ABI882_23045, partial [Acidobacteriota bacterium]
MPLVHRITASVMIAVPFLLLGNVTHGQTWQAPADAQRCPSKWGIGDQRGSGNHMKPEAVLRAGRPNAR